MEQQSEIENSPLVSLSEADDANRQESRNRAQALKAKGAGENGEAILVSPTPQSKVLSSTFTTAATPNLGTSETSETGVGSFFF